MQGPVCLGREAQRCQQGVKPGDRISGCSVLWLPVASSHAHFPELDHLVPPPTSQPFADPGRMAEEFQAEDLELENVEHAAGEEGEGEDATAVRRAPYRAPGGGACGAGLCGVRDGEGRTRVREGGGLFPRRRVPASLRRAPVGGRRRRRRRCCKTCVPADKKMKWP